MNIFSLSNPNGANMEMVLPVKTDSKIMDPFSNHPIRDREANI